MLGTWMAYVVGLGVLLMITAAVVEKAAAALRWSRRWIWIAALAAMITLPIVLPLTTPGPGSEPHALALSAEEPSTSTSVAAFPERVSGKLYLIDRLLAVIWVVSSVIFYAYLLFSAVHLRRIQRTWSSTDLDGQEVWISDSGGPAVIGVFRPKVALPTWILEWSQRDRDVVLRHEAEHASAGDPWLNALGLSAVGLMPWNPSVWWVRRRLGEAIEMDCDDRVLSSSITPRHYAEVLLEVARWTVPVRLSPAALTAANSNLERRITMALEHSSPRRMILGLALLALAGLLAVVPFVNQAPEGPSMAYLGSLALEAQVPPDLDGGMPGRLPFTPSPEQTSFALAMHHPRVLSFGLPEDQRVWFVVDAEMRILHTGVGPVEGLHERVQSLHPESVTDNVIGITHETIDGLTLETTWFVPEPAPLPGG